MRLRATAAQKEVKRTSYDYRGKGVMDIIKHYIVFVDFPDEHVIVWTKGEQLRAP
jgi:hypothetical protein